jgi:nucleoside-diphosphate-sugar epimerase
MTSSVPAADLDHILAHTGDIWRELAGRNLFITGGTGFFGIWLLEAIAAANDILKVGIGATVLSRDPKRFLARMPKLAGHGGFEWLAGHPASFDFPNRRYDGILHLATATSAHLGQTDPRAMLQTKLASICRVLDFARHSGARRMLVTSSGAIYGPQPSHLSRIPETYAGAPDPMKPASAYGQGKRLVEQMCAITPDVDCVIARCFSFIGHHLPLDARYAAGNFLRDSVAGGPIVIHGDGRSVRSYLHAADLTVWLLTLMLQGKPGRAYNVGGDESVTVLELARRIAAMAPRPVDVLVKGAQVDSNEKPPNTYVPDIERARSELGLDVWIDLTEALTRTMEWATATVKSPSG